MSSPRFFIGADPEMVVFNRGKVTSAIPLLVGTKENPQRRKKGVLISHDNVMAEFAISKCSHPSEFAGKIESAKGVINKMLPFGHTVKAMASAVYPTEELEHEEANRFGCDEDFNAWTLTPNERPEPKGGLRTCGGHVHVGAGNGTDFLLDDIGKIDMVKALDATLGMALTAIGIKQLELRRRNMYGQAGCHRPKEYGVEYRTPSSFWISTHQMTRLVYSLVEDAVDLVLARTPTAALDEREIVDIINTCDAKKAKAAVNAQIMANAMSAKTFKLLNITG
jgi:hypothetical protein